MPQASRMKKLCCIFILIISISNVSTAYGTDLKHRKLIIPVQVAENVVIEVEVFLPTINPPRALVIVVPNSGGLADPYFDAELAANEYKPERKGGLTEHLLAADFAVAFYSQRGYDLLPECIQGADFHARSRSFVDNCISTKIRSTVTLHIISGDTRKVFEALDQYSGTKDFPKIALAYSEGMHHVSDLAGKALIRPIGIVAVGGPTTSLSSVWGYQMRRDFYYRTTLTAFKNCHVDIISVNELATCAKLQLSADDLSRFADFFGYTSTTRLQLETRRDYSKRLYDEVRLNYAASKLSDTMAGAFGGLPIPVAFSAHYYKEVFEAHRSAVQQLDGFTGKSIFLFGTLDRLLPETDAADASKFALGNGQTNKLSKTTIPGVGHGLEDASNFPPRRALDAIVHALIDVSYK